MDPFFEAASDLVMTVQTYSRAGWEFSHVPGERRLDISSKIVATKGDLTVNCYSVSDIENLYHVEEKWLEGQKTP